MTGFVRSLAPEVLQSGPAPHDTGPLPAPEHVGIPVEHAGPLLVQKRVFGFAPEINKNDEH